MQGGIRSAAKPRLLLVEDDDGYRYVLARELSSLGYEVIDFQSAMQALNQLGQEPGIKLAVLDLRMPANTLSGLALARMMDYRDKGVNVILMTALPGYLNIPEAAPFGEVLLKTDGIAALALSIHARLSRPANREPMMDAHIHPHSPTPRQ